MNIDLLKTSKLAANRMNSQLQKQTMHDDQLNDIWKT